MLNYFKYFSNIYFEIFCPKIQIRKTISSFHASKCSNTLKLSTLKALLSKNQFYLFFLIFQYTKIPPFFRMPRQEHEFFSYLFLIAFRFQNLTCQVKSLIRTIVSESSLSQLSSRLILLRSILRIHISLHKNMTLEESSVK